MFLGKVVGTVVATQKSDQLAGGKLLVVRHLGIDLAPRDTFAVAYDCVGAGEGEVVVCATGSSARMTEATKDAPVDTAIVAIVDFMELGGKRVFRKEDAARGA